MVNQSFLDEFHLNRAEATPLYLQIAEAVRGAIRSGRLAGGEKLPPTRDLAGRLDVNRTTVVAAYRCLRDEGWVESGIGAGTFVRDGAGSGAEDPRRRAEEGASFWASRIPEMPRPEPRWLPHAGDGSILFTSPTADPELFPVDRFRDVLDRVIRREGAACLDYGPPEGYGPLRDLVAERLARRGASVDRSRVLLVNGSQQGLEIALRLLVPRGRFLLVEEPTYPLALRTARLLDLPVRGVPVDHEGLRVDALERILAETPAGMLYTMPVFQNPTGATLSAGRRRQLLALAARHGLPIVEDDYDAELDYGGEAPGPLLAEGSPPGVVLLGTFSKILFPAPRVGWLVVPEALVGPAREMKTCADLSSGLLAQMALHQFCREGELDLHLARVRDRNGRRLAAMLAALEEEMPASARWTRPAGGMTLWVWLPAGLDSDAVADEAMKRGVAVSPGTMFFHDGRGRDGLRLSFIRESEERIREGIAVLAGTIREMLARPGARDRAGAQAPVL